MTKHFAHEKAATEELEAFGYRKLPNGSRVNNGFVAMIHPIAGMEAVRVSYAPVQ